MTEVEPWDVVKKRWLRHYLNVHEYIKLADMHSWEQALNNLNYGANWAFNYACYTLKRRWDLAEEALLKPGADPGWAIWYAKLVIKGRWPELEEVILTRARNYIPNYVEAIFEKLKDWPEGEAEVMGHPKLIARCQLFKEIL